MRKTLSIATLLCALALPVGAAFDVDTASYHAFNDHSIPATWPIAATCVAEDVNLRSAYILDAPVLGSISSPKEIYMIDYTKENSYEGYGWAQAVTYNGQRAWVNSKFFSIPEKNYTRAERFRAYFNSTIFWEKPELENVLLHPHNPNLQAISQEEGNLHPYIEKKVVIENGITSYGSGDTDDAYIQMMVKITKGSAYDAVGLHIGQAFSGDTLTTFDNDMQSIGWGKYQYDEEKNRYGWYLDERQAGSDYGSFKGFEVTVSDGVITDISWVKHFLD